MSSYRLPQASVTVLTNPRLINSGQDDRVVAIVGLGPATRAVAVEPVVRGAGPVDYLSIYSTVTPNSGATGSLMSSNSNPVGLAGLNYISQGGALYNMGSASVAANGTITWPQGPLSTPMPAAWLDVPPTGSTYYVSYTYNVPASQFNPQILYDQQTVQATYGPENNTTGILSIAGDLVLEQGAQSVMLIQATGSTYSQAAYQTAIDRLKKKSNIEEIICVFPSGSVTRAQQEQLQTYLFSHVTQMVTEGRDRGAMMGSPGPYWSGSDGIDAIGDTTTSGTYCYRANTLKYKEIAYVVPTRVRRYDANSNLMELDANFAAAAVAGVQLAQPLRSTPIHQKVVAGLVLEDEKYNDAELRQLGSAGCLTLISRGGVVTIVDQLTTDQTSANTSELSVVAQERLVKRTLITGLQNVYTSQGVVVSPPMLPAIEATSAALLKTLVQTGELYAYGVTNNPSTGEVPISATQNLQDPREVDITCSVKYLYPLKYAVVTVSTYV
jgi:hypothetical protein